MSLDFQEIKELIQLINNSQINEVNLEHGSTRIKLKKNVQSNQIISEQPTVLPAEVPLDVIEDNNHTSENKEDTSNHIFELLKEESIDAKKELVTINSPMVGTFYTSPSPDKPAYVQTGSKVNTGDIVCILEAMKLFNEIESDVNGEIVEMLVENGQLVEYGQPLFSIRPSK